MENYLLTAYKLVPPLLKDGANSVILSDSYGNVKMTQATLTSGEDQTNDRLKVYAPNSYSNIVLAAPTTTFVKLTSGFLHKVIINKTTALGVITMYDNTVASGNLIGTITMPAALLASQVVMEYNVSFTTGLTIVTSGAAQDITVSFF